MALPCQDVLAQVPGVLPIDPRPDVIELPQHRVLSNIDDDLPPEDARALKHGGVGGEPAARVGDVLGDDKGEHHQQVEALHDVLWGEVGLG